MPKPFDHRSVAHSSSSDSCGGSGGATPAAMDDGMGRWGWTVTRRDLQVVVDGVVLPFLAPHLE